MLVVGTFQEDVLRAVQSLDSEAYGMNIRNFLEANQDKSIHMPQVYAALSRLETLGLLSSYLDQSASAGRRGRTRRVYELSAHGLQYLDARVRGARSSGPKEPYPNASSEEVATA
ncbi:MAG: PadR family transcriptional regulator [Roseovarius sp.]